MSVLKKYLSENFEIKLIEYNSEAYFQELKLRDKVLRQPLGMSLFDEDLSRDSADIHVVVFIGRKLVGCLLLLPLDNEVLKMRQVAVDADFQSLGIGKAMVEFSENRAKILGFKRIVLNARKAALEFYLKQNYHIEGEEFFEVGIPHRKMWKNLI